MSLSLAGDAAGRCTLSRHHRFELIWKPELDYPAGSQVELRSHSLRAFLSWRLAKVKMADGDVTYRWKSQPTPSDIMANKSRVLMRANLPYGVSRGRAYKIELSCIPPVWAGVDQRVSVWTIGPPNAWAPLGPLPEATPERGSECVLRVEAASVERLCVYSKPAADSGGVVTVISPQDRFGNPARFDKPVCASLIWGDEARSIDIQETTRVVLDGRDAVTRAEVRVPMASLGLAENISNGAVEDDCLCVLGNPVWPCGDGYRPAFGEFHWHTELSADGQRSVAEALSSARDMLNLDFAAPGDHNTQGEAWTATVEALEAAHDPGRFVTFFGWESSSSQGHEYYYFTSPAHPLVCGGAAGVRGGFPHELTHILARYEGFLAVPHHTNAVSESRRQDDDAPYWHPYSWTEPTGAHRLVEIFQLRGNQERDDCADAWMGWHQDNRSSVQDALAKGYRVGFTGGTDNHCGWPGRAFAECEGLGINPPWSQILTGVWLKTLDRQPLFDALYARHTWAVWNTRAIVRFFVNDAVMGDEASVKKGTTLKARIAIYAESPLQSVEIVSEASTVWSASSPSLDFECDADLGEAVSSTHFYLRALLRNGGLIYASPVFIDVEPQCG